MPSDESPELLLPRLLCYKACCGPDEQSYSGGANEQADATAGDRSDEHQLAGARLDQSCESFLIGSHTVPRGDG